MERCLAKPSILDQITSLGSIYYILFGVFTGIFRAVGPCLSADWPYLSLCISWALFPIIMKTRRKVVVGDPRDIFLEKVKDEPEDKEDIPLFRKIKEMFKNWFYMKTLCRKIVEMFKNWFYIKTLCRKIVEMFKNEEDEPIDTILVSEPSAKKRSMEDLYDIFTAIASMTVPWGAVVIAYFTRPIGFSCRSKYLSVLCCIWSCNSVLAYFLHRGGKNVGGNMYFKCYFCVSGLFIAFLLVLLSLLSHSR